MPVFAPVTLAPPKFAVALPVAPPAVTPMPSPTVPTTAPLVRVTDESPEVKVWARMPRSPLIDSVASAASGSDRLMVVLAAVARTHRAAGSPAVEVIVMSPSALVPVALTVMASPALPATQID